MEESIYEVTPPEDSYFIIKTLKDDIIAVIEDEETGRVFIPAFADYDMAEDYVENHVGFDVVYITEEDSDEILSYSQDIVFIGKELTLKDRIKAWFSRLLNCIHRNEEE